MKKKNLRSFIEQKIKNFCNENHLGIYTLLEMEQKFLATLKD